VASNADWLAHAWRNNRSGRQEPDIPPMTCEHKQPEFCMPDDPLREFVVSIDAAHVRGADPKAARNFEIAVAHGGRGSPPGQCFANAKYQIPEMRHQAKNAKQPPQGIIRLPIINI
jgi:hypothetical protein